MAGQGEGGARGRTVHVMAAIRHKVESRALVSGDRLPSIRGLARSMGVSPPPWWKPHDRLAAEGLIRARPGAGFFVTKAEAPLDLARLGPRLDRPVDPLWVARQSLDTEAHTLKPGCGWLPDDWMPGDAIRRAMRRLARSEDAVLFGYGATRGAAGPAPPARPPVCRRGAGGGPGADPAGGLGHTGHRSALPLPAAAGRHGAGGRSLLFQFPVLLRAHQARIVGVPMTPEGPDLALLRRRRRRTSRASTSPIPPATIPPAQRFRPAPPIRCSTSRCGPPDHRYRGRHLR